MKRLLLICVLTFSCFAIFSCKKKIYGCTQENALNYNPDANQSVDNCVFKDEIVFTIDKENVSWSGGDWTQGSPFPFIFIEDDVIDEHVIENGIIEGYIRKTGTTVWSDIPSIQCGWGTSLYSDTVEIGHSYQVGKFEVYAISSSMGAADLPHVDIRLLIHR